MEMRKPGWSGMAKQKTLIDKIVIVLGIVMVASALAPIVILVTHLERRRGHSPVAGAIGLLQTLSTSQAQFQSNTAVDQDEDGVGEYGLLNELTGTTNMRAPQGKRSEKTILPPYVSKTLAVTSQNFVIRRGYCYQVFLPHKGNVITDNPTGQNGSTDQDSINAQEKRWIAYAWPLKFADGSNICLVVDQDAEVYVAPNRTADGQPLYEGTRKTPAWNAAMDKTQLKNSMEWAPIADSDKDKSVDGQEWRLAGS